MIKSELNLFFNALAYYSRIPVPRNIKVTPEIQTLAFRYFPLVGIIIGVVGAVVYGISCLLFPVHVSTMLSLAAMLLASGAIHEDGLADFFDGFGGGYTKERILLIMKDSHIGTYGVIALIVSFMIKYAVLTALSSSSFMFLCIAAQGFSRILPLVLINSSIYARVEASKGDIARNKLDNKTLFIAGIIGVLPLFFFSYPFIGILIPLSLLFLVGFRNYLHKKIGGYTGDTLGALQQITEIICYLSFLIAQTVA